MPPIGTLYGLTGLIGFGADDDDKLAMERAEMRLKPLPQPSSAVFAAVKDRLEDMLDDEEMVKKI